MRIKPLYIVLLFGFIASGKIYGQDNIIKSLERQEPGTGVVTIHQDKRLESLIGTKHSNKGNIADTKVLKEPGYRIQVYAGGDSRNSKSAAYQMEEQVKGLFPELPVYTVFRSPRWLCQVGDYKTIEEAYAMMRKMKQFEAFSEASIVKTQIIIPL